ncbi:MAG: hypothetical protein Q8L47_01640 [bacterium]|nr:hypothetical protein [bacterium]
MLMLTTSGCYSILQVGARQENGIWDKYPGGRIDQLNWFTGVGKVTPQGTSEQRQVLLDFGGSITDEACSQNCSPSRQTPKLKTAKTQGPPPNTEY